MISPGKLGWDELKRAIEDPLCFTGAGTRHDLDEKALQGHVLPLGIALCCLCGLLLLWTCSVRFTVHFKTGPFTPTFPHSPKASSAVTRIRFSTQLMSRPLKTVRDDGSFSTRLNKIKNFFLRN